MTLGFMPIAKSGRAFSKNGQEAVVRIDGSEVCTRYWHHHKDYFDKGDFAGIAPPAEVCLVEVSDPPAQIVASGVLRDWYPHVDSYCVVYEFCKVGGLQGPDSMRKNLRARVSDMRAMERKFGRNKNLQIQVSLSEHLLGLSDFDLASLAQEAQGFTGATLAHFEVSELLYIRKLDEIYPVIFRTRYLDKHGRILGQEQDLIGIVAPDKNPLAVAVKEMGESEFAHAFLPFLDSCLEVLGFLSCKNISLVEKHEQMSRQVRRAMQRSGQSPVFKYHILSITSPGSSKSGFASDAQSLTALHVCRGHFKRYTAEAPLFGRLTGTFYIPQHTRGRAENGVIAKDYKVVNNQ